MSQMRSLHFKYIVEASIKQFKTIFTWRLFMVPVTAVRYPRVTLTGGSPCRDPFAGGPGQSCSKRGLIFQMKYPYKMKDKVELQHLQQEGAHRPGWLGPWHHQQEEEEQGRGQVGGHRGQVEPMGPLIDRRITPPPEKVESLTCLCAAACSTNSQQLNTK